MTHFTERELQQWSDAGPGADRDRVVVHVGACASCAARYAEAIRARPLSEGAMTHESADHVRGFAAVGYDIPSRETVARFRPRRAAIVGLAAAAALVAAFALPSLVRHPPVTPGTTFRGGGIHALAPVGAVAGGTEFSWSSDVLPVTYRVEIGDASGAIHGENTADVHLRLSPETWAALSPNVDYWWTVTALDRDGRVIATSDRQTFSVRPR